jgi:hypothetical protein
MVCSLLGVQCFRLSNYLCPTHLVFEKSIAASSTWLAAAATIKYPSVSTFATLRIQALTTTG